MKTVGLISCCKAKVKGARGILAQDLNQGALFKASYNYLKSRNVDMIFILSAKYGLVENTERIDDYELRVPKNTCGNLAWAKGILFRLREKTNLENDSFIVMAGDDYKKNLLPKLCHYECPLEGHGGLGKQLQWLNGVNGKNG